LNRSKDEGRGGIPVKNYIFSSLSGRWLTLLWKVCLLLLLEIKKYEL